MLSSSKVFFEITNNTKPDIAIILGSGLTKFFGAQDEAFSVFSDRPTCTTLTGAGGAPVES